MSRAASCCGTQVRVGPGIGSLGGNAALVGEFIESGAVPIAVAPTVEVGDVVAHLSMYLRADRVLKVSYTLAGGADLHAVWLLLVDRPLCSDRGCDRSG